MSSIALAVVLIVAGAPAEAVRTTAAVPEAVLVHPAAGSLPPETPRWRRSAQDFAAWSGPSVQQPNLYDERYVTW
jgi:hypothetical protein